jgi:iron complex outermembrane receptor protein
VPVAEGTFRGNVLGNYQTNNEMLALHANLAGNNHGFNWNAYGTFKKAGDYRNKYDGRVLNSRFNEKNAGGYIGLNKSWGFSHLVFSHFEQETGLVEGDRDDLSGRFLIYPGTPFERIAGDVDLDSKNMLTPFQNIQHNKLVSDNNFALGKNRLKIILGYQNNLRREFGNPEDISEEELFFDLKTFTYNLHWQLPEIKEWHTTIGVNGMSQSNKNKGAEVLIPAYNLSDIGAFVYTQRFFNKATLSGGFRFDNRNVNGKEHLEGSDLKFAAFEKSFSNISGSLGLSYEPKEEITIKVNIARGFRAPTLAEMASNGAHEGTNRYEYGDRDLGSETSFQLDGGIEFNYEHFNISLTGFYNSINDFIFYRKLASTLGGDSLVEVGGDQLAAFQFDQHNASLRGFEASIDIHPHPLDWLHFENSVSFVRGSFEKAIDGSRNIPLMPATRLVSQLRADIPKSGKLFQRLYLKLEADNTFRQEKYFSGYNTETATAAYTLLNASTGAEILHKKKVLFSIHLVLTNITDKAYQQHLSRLKYTDINNTTGRTGVFNAGRNFSVKLNVPVEW